MKLSATALVLIWTLAALAGLTARAADCANASVGLTPLNDLGTGLYLGQFEGGLYPGGSNYLPPAHDAEGLARAAGVEPLDMLGNPSPTGKMVLLSIGMSNTTQEFCGSSNPAQPCASWTFAGQAAVDTQINHATLVIVNGAMGGQTAMTWDSPTDPNYDRVRDTLLVPQGLSEAQVQVAWVKVANAQPSVSLPAANSDAYTLETFTGGVMRALKSRYPNIQIAFVSSRIYAGYARNTSTLNPEPYAYESGFSMKWLIEAQIDQMAGGGVDPRAGDLDYNAAAPWIAWGAYLWADGLAPRSDGLIWQCSDLDSDGTHPAQSGEQKVGAMLLDFMFSSPFASPWFRSGTGPIGDGDCDDDGDVDLSDWASVSACLAGPGVAPDMDCTCADFNGDGDGDLADFAAFQAAFAVAPQVMDPAFDDFERAGLGENWRVIAGPVGIVNASDIGVVSSGAGVAAWQGSTFAADQFSEGVLSAAWNPANNLEVGVRMSLANGARYAFRRMGGGALSLRYESGGSPVILASAPGPALAPGDTVRIEVEGGAIRGMINGAVVLTAADSNIVNGTAGVTFLAATGTPAAYFESWSGGSIP